MKLLSLLTAAAALLIVSACASTPAPTDERVQVTVEETSLQPGIVYVSPKAAEIFTLRNIESEINENGFLAVRVFGKTAELSALKWAFFGDINYDFCFGFAWFDAEGNQIVAPEVDRRRSATPGDPVRFVSHAPTEECRNFALILKLASEVKSSEAAAQPEEDGEAEEAADKDAKSKAAEEEEERIKGSIPTLPQENVSGDKNEVKVIGVPDKDAASVPKAVGDTPAAVPAEKQ